MNQAEDNKDKMFYSMGEVTELLDVKASLVRYWEGEFTIIKPHKNKKGNRMFTPKDVENLKLIHHLLKDKRLTIEGAKKYLKAGKKGSEDDTMELIDRLMSIRSTLEELRMELSDDEPTPQPVKEVKAQPKPSQLSEQEPLAEVVAVGDEVTSLRIIEQTLF